MSFEMNWQAISYVYKCFLAAIWNALNNHPLCENFFSRAFHNLKSLKPN